MKTTPSVKAWPCPCPWPSWLSAIGRRPPRGLALVAWILAVQACLSVAAAEPPLPITASIDNRGQLRLNWPALEADRAYTVEFKDSLGLGSWQPTVPVVGGWPTALTNWHDTIGLGSASRFYRVRADLLTVPPPVADVRVQPEEGALAVRWAAVPLATSYTLYWSTNQPFVAGEAQAQTVTRTEFILLDPFAGLDYFFAVRALGQQGASDLSAVVSGMAFPPAPPFRPTTLGDSTAFLYSGPSPLQRDVAPGTIDPQRVAIVRSTIRSRAGAALGGVTVRVAQRPEFGSTESRPDGTYDLAVNGGVPVTLEYRKPGYLPVHRRVQTRWQQFSRAPEIVLTPLDSRVTPVVLGTAASLQVARGSEVRDSDGQRQAKLLIAPGTAAELVLADGTRQAAGSLHLRATEYTVGENGIRAMPAELPPETAYTYCVEFSADEALSLEAREIRFDRPLHFYEDNFLRFPVGCIVPVGYYDRAETRWMPSANGRVIGVLGVQNSRADLDLDGTGQVANSTALAVLGITDEERLQLAALYQPGQSFWRVPITHFTPWDCNWPAVPPDDAAPPDLPWDKPPPDPDDPCDPPRPIVEYQTQVLGERIPLVGLPYSLNYRSDRVPGFFWGDLAEVPLSLDRLPASLKRIDFEVFLAGRWETASYPPWPNLKHPISWDGRDTYGRSVVGTALAQVRVGYAYDVVYVNPAESSASFGRFGSTPISGNAARDEVVLWQEWNLSLGRRRWDARIQGLGGWTLSEHHLYDPVGRVLYLGDGSRRTVGTELLPQIVRTVAGGGSLGEGAMEGQPATRAQLAWPLDLALGPDGSVYIADTDNYCVRQVRPDGTLRTLAGNGTMVYSGDGGPALETGIVPIAVARGPDGSLYVTDLSDTDPPTHQVPQQGQIRRVSPDGRITTLAGLGIPHRLGDEGPARQAFLWYPTFLCATPDGALYVSDSRNDRVRKIEPDGLIHTVAGGGDLDPGRLGDGGPSTRARLSLPYGIALGPDGSLYIADSGHHRIRRVAPSGIITTYAGTGDPGYSGDNGPAREAELGHLSGLALGWDGSLYFPDTDPATAAAIYVRRISPDGRISRAVGGGAPDDGVGEGLRATQVGLWKANTVAIGPDGTLFICDSGNDRIRRLEPVLPGVASADFYIPSENGQEAFFFNPSGRHLRTVHALTAAALRRFEYDTAGRLITVVDGDGNTTRIERSANGDPLAIVGPFGQRTRLDVNAQGYLAQVINPAGETVRLDYGFDGLLTRFTDSRGHATTFDYGIDGRLVEYRDPEGGGEHLTRSEDPQQRQIVSRTVQGRVTTYRETGEEDGSRERLRIDPCGAETRLQIGPDEARSLTQPDGTEARATVQPDPRFGLRAPLPRTIQTAAPSGLMSILRLERQVELEDPEDPFSLLELTEITEINGRRHTVTYDAATRTLTQESAAGRQRTLRLDALGRSVEVQRDTAALDPIGFTRAANGWLTRVSAGDWIHDYEYDARGRRTEQRDAEGRRFRFEYNEADRVIRQTLPSGRAVGFRYDASGNRTELVMPDGKVHQIEYSPTGALLAYQPPARAAYRWTYLPDHGIDAVRYPDGHVLRYGYDGCGRLAALTSPTAVVAFDYAAGGLGCCGESGRIARIAAVPEGLDPASQLLDFTYDGTLVTQVAFSGFAAGTFHYTYDTNFFLTAIGFNTDPFVPLERDEDGLVVRYGQFELTRDGPMGAISAITDGVCQLDLEYDGLGRVVTRRYRLHGEDLYACEWVYGPAGFVTEQLETLGEAISATRYELDPDGLLTGVVVDEAAAESYAYDPNGNRLTSQGATATYDARDCLSRRGTVAYEFDANGCLAHRGADGFEYGLRGELLRATVAGQTVRYVYDGLGRRVGRLAPEGMLRYLYGNPSQPFQISVMLDAVGVATRFYYDDDGLLFAFDRQTTRFYVVTDPRGTPRIVSRADGAIVRTLRHDSYGRVLKDSDPASDLPVGFAGGLPDPATGLVRFGWRDYEPESGRWTTPDPLLHQSRDPNPYLYASGNPVSYRDPWGLLCVAASAYAGIGGGGSICFDASGASACVELGVGVGAGAGVSSAGPSPSGTSLGAEVSASVGLAGGSLSGSINECGKASLDASASLGPSADARTIGKVGVSAKITVTHCWQLN